MRTLYCSGGGNMSASQPGLRSSAQAFMRAGGVHAQFLGVIVTVVALTTTAVFYAGSRVNSWAEEAHKIRVKLEKEREVRQVEREVRQVELEKERGVGQAQQQALQAQVAQARAEAIQETIDKFLIYGYAEEYSKISKETLAARPDPE